MRLPRLPLPLHPNPPPASVPTNLPSVTHPIELHPNRARAPHLGHRPELNRNLPTLLAGILPRIPEAIAAVDPGLFNELVNTELPPAALPHARLELEAERASTPSHKWRRIFRINDLERAFTTRR